MTAEYRQLLRDVRRERREDPAARPEITERQRGREGTTDPSTIALQSGQAKLQVVFLIAGSQCEPAPRVLADDEGERAHRRDGRALPRGRGIRQERCPPTMDIRLLYSLEYLEMRWTELGACWMPLRGH